MYYVITNSPVLHVKDAEMLTSGEDEKGCVQREGIPGVLTKRKILGYFGQRIDNQPLGQLYSFHEVCDGPQSLPLSMVAQPWGCYTAGLVSIMTLAREVTWKSASSEGA